jgi:DNA-binding GntR family transcriptional regulator
MRQKTESVRKKPRETAAQRRFQRIYREIRDRIILLRYQPGTVLRETDLAEEFEVSRTPIRQVLQRLQFEGLVETRNAVGTIVTGFDLESLKGAYEVRIKIGEWAGEMATRLYSRADILEMVALLERTEKLPTSRDADEYWRIANEVHQVLGRIIDNDTLKTLYDLLYFQTARSWFEVIPATWEKNVEYLCSELAEMIKSMEAGDTKGVTLVRRNYHRLFLSLLDRHIQQHGANMPEREPAPDMNRSRMLGLRFESEPK